MDKQMSPSESIIAILLILLIISISILTTSIVISMLQQKPVSPVFPQDLYTPIPEMIVQVGNNG